MRSGEWCSPHLPNRRDGGACVGVGPVSCRRGSRRLLHGQPRECSRGSIPTRRSRSRPPAFPPPRLASRWKCLTRLRLNRSPSRWCLRYRRRCVESRLGYLRCRVGSSPARSRRAVWRQAARGSADSAAAGSADRGARQADRSAAACLRPGSGTPAPSRRSCAPRNGGSCRKATRNRSRRPALPVCRRSTLPRRRASASWQSPLRLCLGLRGHATRTWPAPLRAVYDLQLPDLYGWGVPNRSARQLRSPAGFRSRSS